LLEKAVERLKAEFQPEEIYLFGSHARGTPTDDSDVDLMVIVRESSEKAIRRMQRTHRCLTGMGFSKDVLVPTRAQVQFARRRTHQSEDRKSLNGRTDELHLST
jgi:predicted nucleotidyltransferase